MNLLTRHIVNLDTLSQDCPYKQGLTVITCFHSPGILTSLASLPTCKYPTVIRAINPKYKRRFFTHQKQKYFHPCQQQHQWVYRNDYHHFLVKTVFQVSVKVFSLRVETWKPVGSIMNKLLRSYGSHLKKDIMFMKIVNLIWVPLFTVLRKWIKKTNSKPCCRVLFDLFTVLEDWVLTWCMATSVNHVLPSWSIVKPWGIKNLDKKKHRIQKR